MGLLVFSYSQYHIFGEAGSAFDDWLKIRKQCFMAENTDNIYGINVEVVIHLIKCMSHSMYYKVQNQYGSSGMPFIRYNGHNLELLYQEMQRVMRE